MTRFKHLFSANHQDTFKHFWESLELTFVLEDRYLMGAESIDPIEVRSINERQEIWSLGEPKHFPADMSVQCWGQPLLLPFLEAGP